MARTTLKFKAPEEVAVEPEPTLSVRVGTPDDVDAMMEIALAACEENGFVDPNPIKLLQHIYAALSRDHGIVGIIGDPGEQIQAAVLLRIGTPWYSDVQTLEEKAIFVHPDYRTGNIGRARLLCEFSMMLADSLGLTLSIGVLSSERTAAKVRMYGRVLGPSQGAYWIYNGKTGLAGDREI